MADTYSPNLGITLMEEHVHVESWGGTNNANLGTLIEQAISGYVTQAITDGADTVITLPDGATGVARNMYLELTGALTADRNLVVPTNKKLYFIYNNTTGGKAVTVKVSGQTGVSVLNGSKLLLTCNGTDIVKAISYINPAELNVFTAPQRPAISAELSPVANEITWDLTTTAILRINLTANITTFNLTGALADLDGYPYQCVVRYNGGTLISWPASFNFAGGTPPTLTGTSGKIDIFTFIVSTNDGATYEMFQASMNV